MCTGLQGAGPDPHCAPGSAASTAGLPGRCLQWAGCSPSQALLRAGLGAPETAGRSQDRPAGEEVLPGWAAWAWRWASAPRDAVPRTLDLPRVLSRLCHPPRTRCSPSPLAADSPSALCSLPVPFRWSLPCSPLSSVTRMSVSPQPIPSPRPPLPTCSISPQLGLDVPNSSAPQQQAPPPRRLQALLEDLLDAQKVLQDVDVLSALALLLPQGACAGRAPGPPASSPGGTANGTATGVGTGPNTTAEDGAPSAATQASSDALQGQCSAFVQLWAALQPILCGNNR